MNVVQRRIDKLGRIVLPMDFRRALGLLGEAEVAILINGNTISVRSADAACRLCGSDGEISKDFGICSKCIEIIKNNELK